MSLQEILDKLLKKEGDEAMPGSHHIARFDLECLKPIEHSPRKKSLQYFVDEWKKRGNLYSLDEKEPIAVADVGGIYCVYNGNQRVLFYLLNGFNSVEAIGFTPTGFYQDIFNGALRLAENMGILSFNDLATIVERPESYRVKY